MTRPEAAPLPLRSRQLLWIGAVLAALVLALSAAMAIIQRDTLLETGQRRIAEVAHLLEGQTARHLDAAELALENLALRARQLPAGRLHELDGDLVEAARSLPLLRSLSLLDVDGRVRANGAPDNRDRRIDLGRLARPRSAEQVRIGRWSAGRDLVDLSDPAERLRHPGENQDQAAHEGPARPPGLGFSTLARLARSADGEPLLAVATLNPELLANDYDAALHGSGLRVSLLDLQGQMIASTAGAGLEPGQHATLSAPLAERLARADAGSLIATALAGDELSAQAFRSLARHPWLLLVEQPVALIIAPWLRDLGWLMVLTVLLLSGVGLSTYTAWRALAHRERLDESLARLNLDLAEQERTLRGLIEAAPAPMFVLAEGRHYTMLNRAFEDFLGVSREDLLAPGAPLSAPLQRLAHHPQYDTQLWDSGARSHYLDDLPGVDGRLREVLVSKVLVPGEDGRPAVVIGSITDVTELREAERHTREATQRAERAIEGKNEFIANTSHGLRSPLQSIMGFAELGKWRSGEQPQLQDMFVDILKTSKRMLVLVNDLLDVSKLQSTVGTMHRDATDVVALSHELIESRRARAADARLALQLDGLLAEAAAAPVLAWVDGLRLQQALGNLLDNALRHAPHGSVVTLHLACDDETQHLHWRLHDRGPAVPDYEQALLFEPFFHGLRTRDEDGGHDLGLAIAQQILQAHGGQLACENPPSGGLVFVVTLPTGMAAPPTATAANDDTSF